MFKAATRNPWTTAGGIATAIGVSLAMSDAGTIPDWLRGGGQVLVVVGPLVIGWCARDSSTSSEEAGAK